MTKDTGGPAFGQVVELRCVRVDPTGGEEWEPALAQGGMTLRDYFAAKALQGFCANPAVFAANGMSGWDLVNCTEQQLAEVCNRMADEMLKARTA